MRKTTDHTRKKIAPVVITVLVVLYICPLFLVLLDAAGAAREAGVRLTLPVLCYLFLGGAVVVGVIRALLQRLEEIDGGEEDDASQY